MKSVAEVKAFVNSQIEFHEKKVDSYAKRAEKVPPSIRPQYAARVKSHNELLVEFHAALEVLDSLNGKPLQSSALSSPGLSLTPADIDGLPPELIQELSISDTDMAEFAIISIMNDAGGIMTLDKILIALYKRTGEVNKRTTVNGRIYRMVQKGSLFAVPGKKGVYSTKQITDLEADLIL